jgi:hypothetical protein
LSENTVTVTEYGVDDYSVDQWSIKIQDLSNVTLESQSSSVSGAANHVHHLEEGEIVSQTSTVSGSAERLIPSASITLQSQQSSVSGSAKRNHQASGAIYAGDAEAHATVERVKVAFHADLVTSGITLSGTAERSVTASTTVALQSQDASTNGNSFRTFDISAALVTDGITLTTNAHKVLEQSVALQAQDVSVTGAGVRGLNVSIALTQGESSVTGEGSKGHSANGVLTVTSSTVAGQSAKGLPSSGALTVGTSTVTGISERSVVSIEADLTADEIGLSAVVGVAENIVVEVDATLESGDAIVSGAGVRTSNGTGVLESGASTVDAAGAKTQTITATLVAQSSAVVGVAEHTHVAVGGASLESGESTVTATVREGSNVLDGIAQCDESSVSGSGIRGANGIGTLVSQQSFLAAVSENIITSVHGDLHSDNATVVGTGAKTQTINSGILQDTDSSITCVAKRTVNAGNAIVVDDATVVGAGTIGRSSSGQLIVTDNAVVIGVSERSVVSIEADLTADEIGVSAVVGVGENIIISTAVHLVAGPITITCDAFRSKILNVEIESQDSKVVVTDGIRHSNGSGVLVSSSSTTTGLAENIIVSSGVLTQGESTVVGAGVRHANGTGNLIVTDQSIVTGLAERQINLLDFTINSGPSRVTGVSENIVVPQHSELESGPSIVVGLGVRHANSLESSLLTGESEVTATVERTSNGSGVLVTGQVIVTGIAENSIDQEGGGDFTVSDSLVVGAGVRTSNVLEGEISADEVGISSITGISEREIIEDAALSSQDATATGLGVRHANGTGILVQSSPSVVAGIAEREVDGVSGIEQGDDATVTGTSIRTIVNVPNVGIVGDLIAYGPDENGPALSYVDPYTVLYSGTGQQYQVLKGNKSFTLKIEFGNLVAEETFNTVTKDYNLYWRDKGEVVAPELRWDVIFYSTTAGRWYQEEFEQHPAEWYDGQILEAYSAINTVELTSIDAVRDGGASTRLYAPDAHIAAISENIIPVIHSDLKSGPATLTSVIHRILPATSLDYKMPDVTVIGLGERTLNNDGLGQQLVTTPSIVTGLAERFADVNAIALKASDVKLTADVERILNNDGAGQQLFSGASTVTATTKRELKPIDSSDGIAQVDDAVVVGLGERTVNVSGALVSGPSSTVSGIAEDIHDQEGGGDFKADDSIVVGVANRQSNTLGQQQLISDDADVDGTAERVITVLDGIAPITSVYYGPSTAEGYVSYVGNDVVVSGLSSTANGTYIATPKRFVAGFDVGNNRYEYVTENDYGVFERDNRDGTFDILLWSTQINYWAVFVGETTSIYNVVAGDDLKDISPDVCASLSIQVGFRGTSTTPSIVSGVGERTLNNDGLGQSIESGSSEVIGAGFRTSVRLPDFLGPLAISPDSNDSNVSYVGRDLVISGLLGHLAIFNGTYQQHPVASCFIESGNNHIYHVDEFSDTEDIANWYISKTDAYGGYLFTFYDKTQSKWFISFTSDNPYEWQDGHVTNGTNALKTEVAYASELRPSGFKTQKGNDSIVAGYGERLLNNQPIGQQVESGPASVVGVSVRNAKPIDGDTNSDDSQVVGVGKVSRLPIVADLKAGQSNVFGVSENIVIQTQRPNLKGGPVTVTALIEITSNSISANIKSSPSTVSGVAENRIDQEVVPSRLRSEDSKVVGIAERTITASGAIKVRLPIFSQKGEAERKIVLLEGELNSGDSRTNGSGKRLITGVGENRLYSGNNRPWQLTGSTNVDQILDPNADPTIKPRVGGEHTFNPVVHQDLAFQEAIPIYKRILVRAPRKRR